ncbi:acyltransferase family protein [Mariniluteicoccus flavus]
MTTPAAPPTAEKATARQRLHGLDALRGGALLLGIVLHGLLGFVPGFPWIVSDSQKSPVAGVVSMWIHLFRMPLFMFLAGFFARMSVGRRGAADFARDRLKRIGLPFLVFAPLMLVTVAAVGTWAMARQGITEPPAPPPGVPLVLVILNPGHLWFLWTLLQLYAVALLARAAVGDRAWARNLGVRLGDALTRPGGVLLAAIPYWLAMEVTGKIIGGPVTLLPEPGPSLAFLGAFLAGWFCWGRPEAMPRLARQWPHHLAGAAVTLVIMVAALGTTTDMEAHIAPVWLRLVGAAGVWLWCYGLLGLCVAVFTRENAAIRYLADASYWMYLIHLPLVLVMQVLLADLAWWWPLKAALIIGVPVAVLLASYHLLVRPTWLGAWLNGRKYAAARPRVHP